MIALLSAPLLTCVLAWPRGDAADAWRRLPEAPCPGVVDSESWVFSCMRRDRDPAVDASMDRAMAQQEAVDAMLAARLGAVSFPASVPAAVQREVLAAFEGFRRAEVTACGMQSFDPGPRPAGQVSVVVALPASAFDGARLSCQAFVAAVLPQAQKDGIVAMALLAEVAEGAQRERVLSQLEAAAAPLAAFPTGVWVPGWRAALDPAQSPAGSLQDARTLLAVLEVRPGDAALIRRVADALEAAGCGTAAARIRALAAKSTAPSAPEAAPSPGGLAWSSVSTEGLPSMSAAVVRSGGALRAVAARRGAALEKAQALFARQPPDLLQSERLALECAEVPDADALNLAAASILADGTRSSPERSRWALALAWQAAQLSPGHPYAFGNVLAALKALDAKAEAKAVLAGPLRPRTPSDWIVRKIAETDRWLKDG